MQGSNQRIRTSRRRGVLNWLEITVVTIMGIYTVFCIVIWVLSSMEKYSNKIKERRNEKHNNKR